MDSRVSTRNNLASPIASSTSISRTTTANMDTYSNTGSATGASSYLTSKDVTSKGLSAGQDFTASLLSK